MFCGHAATLTAQFGVPHFPCKPTFHLVRVSIATVILGVAGGLPGRSDSFFLYVVRLYCEKCILTLWAITKNAYWHYGHYGPSRPIMPVCIFDAAG